MAYASISGLQPYLDPGNLAKVKEGVYILKSPVSEIFVSLSMTLLLLLLSSSSSSSLLL